MTKLPKTPPRARSDGDKEPEQKNTATRSAPVRDRRRALPPQSSPSDEGRARDYAVGYGRPPEQTRFRTGESGNPRGRPKGARGLNTLVREMMTETVPVRTAAGMTKMPRVQAMLLKQFELALKGNLRAQSQLLALYAEAVPEDPLDDAARERQESAAYLRQLAIEFLENAPPKDERD